MKKTYIHPEMETVKIDSVQLLAGSDLGFGDGSINGEDAGSRSDDFWDWGF